MIPLAISVLWFLIGVIILGAVVWIALSVLHSVFPNLPSVVDRAVWGVFGILCLIYALMLISGGAPRLGFWRYGSTFALGVACLAEKAQTPDILRT